MITDIINDELLNALKKTGLTQSEALVYLSLLHYGKEGVRVMELNKNLISLKRTTIYSILKKLEELQAITVIESDDTPRNARKYILKLPSDYYQDCFEKIKKDLENLEYLRPIFEKKLVEFYNQPAKMELMDINEILRPYIEPLLIKGWTIKSGIQEEHIPVLNCSLFEVFLTTNKFYLIDEVPFHLFLFDFNIEEDQKAFHYFMKSILADSHKIISNHLKSTEFELNERTVEILGHRFPGYYIRFDKNTIKDNELLPSLLEYYHLKNFNQLPESIEFGSGIAIPVKNKLFFLWAESKEIIEMGIKPIVDIEIERKPNNKKKV